MRLILHLSGFATHREREKFESEKVKRPSL